MFIKINNDIIINSDHIRSIERQAVTTERYDEWLESYNTTMNGLVKEYLIQHPEELAKTSEDELVESLIKRFSKYVEKSLGGRPDAFEYSYYIILDNNETYDIKEYMYNELCKTLDIKFIDLVFPDEHEI